MLTKFDEYFEKASDISKNDNGDPLIESEINLYNLDKIAKNQKLNHYKTTDAIKIKGNNIFLIEFKGGEEILNYDISQLKEEIEKEQEKLVKYEKINKLHKKQEIQASFKLKISETLLFVLPQILEKKLEEILKDFKIWYIIVVSDNINLHSNSNQIWDRFRFLINYSKPVKFGLNKYNKGTINKIITENANFFDSKIVTHF